MGFFEIFAAILAFFYGIIQSYGLAIILLTITVRIVLLPLSIKQTRSMREMQMIQPEIKKIQAKYKGNRQKMNEEMMALYKEHGVNPLGGCLPLLLQMPVLIGLFYVIRNPLKYLSETTTLAQDLMTHALSVNQFIGIRLDCSAQLVLQGEPSQAIPTASCGNGFVDAIPYLVMVLLMGFTTYYQQKQMQASRGPTQDSTAQQMQTFAKIMPFMLMIFAFSFPSGVVLYWLTTNVWTIVQQRIMLRAAPPIVPGQKPKKVTGKAVEANLIDKGSGSGTKKNGGNSKGSTAATPGKDGQAGAAKPTSKPHPSSKKKKRR